MVGCSIVLGPVLGGVITDSATWHWIFWINLPVMGVVLLCVLIAIMANGPDLRGENYDKPWQEKRHHLDWLGTCLLALVMVPLILALQLSQPDHWRTAKVIVLLGTCVVGVIALALQQTHTRKEKILVPAVILNKAVWTTCGLFFAALSSLSVLVLFLPFLLQVWSRLFCLCHKLTKNSLSRAFRHGTAATTLHHWLLRSQLGHSSSR